MPFNGAGVYSPPGADFPAVTQTVISSTHYNNVINDLATGLSLCLTKDGQQVATANIPFGGFRATNVGITAIAGSVGTPAINVSDAATGLYRSAASELAVTIAGTQRARFDSTGLIVTGAASVSSGLTVSASGITVTGNSTITGTLGGVTVLTVSTNVVTPQVGPSTDIDLVIANAGVSAWIFRGSPNNYDLLPSFGSNSQSIGRGSPANLIKQIFTPIIDSGSAGSVSIKTNGGTTQLELTHTAGANHVQITSGTNPTIAVSAGSLAITPAVVLGSFLSFAGTVATAGTIRLVANDAPQVRNNANTVNMFLPVYQTTNGVADTLLCGDGNSNGMLWKARSGGAAPTTSDLPVGYATLWRDTGGATTKLYYNNAGAIQSVALA